MNNKRPLAGYNLFEPNIKKSYYSLAPEQIENFIAEKQHEIRGLKHLLERRRKEEKRAKRITSSLSRTKHAGETAALFALALIKKGYTEATAIEETARDLSLDKKAVAYHYKNQLRRDAAKARQIRNREILRLAGKGWTNKKLGEKFDLSPSSVSQIIQKSLRP